MDHQKSLVQKNEVFLSKPQAWYGINALAHCMASPWAYGITKGVFPAA